MTQARRIGALSTGYPRILPPTPTALRTGADGLVVGEVWVPVDDGELPAYRAMPAGAGPHPILLVVQEVFGVDEYLKDTCRRAAHEGFVAIAPELYARQGKAGECETREALFAIVGAAPDAQVLSDLDACMAFAANACSADATRLGVTGFCWGGRIVWLYAAHNPRLRAGVAWYGRLVGDTDPRHPRQPLDVAAELHAPVLGLYGGADQGIPLETVERMKAALAAARSKSEFVVYDGAPHAFHADYRVSYQPESAKDGWSRMLAWLRVHGAG
jgi:carboxymethylenebutenolidase